MLVHRQGVARLQPDTNGKLLLTLSVAFRDATEQIVSRYKAKDLKSWLANA